MNCSFNPGKFIVLGFTGSRPESNFIRLIQRNPPSGFLLLSENYENPLQMQTLISHLKSVVGSRTFFLVDQEPGRVQRFNIGFPRSRLPREYTIHEVPDAFKTWCRDTAELLADLGITLNLAPVVDLCSYDTNYPVLNGRAFGDEPETVATVASILIEEFRKFGIRTCAKHFPGLGAAKCDPHETMAISDEPERRFLNYHWSTFREAVASRVDWIMTTHLLARSLDPNMCATYSSNIIQRLRDEIGHTGLVISDDLFMGGAAFEGGQGQAAIQSLIAGHNLLIVSRDLRIQIEVMDALRKRYDDDACFRKIADELGNQIDRFKNESDSQKSIQ